ISWHPLISEYRERHRLRRQRVSSSVTAHPTSSRQRALRECAGGAATTAAPYPCRVLASSIPSEQAMCSTVPTHLHAHEGWKSNIESSSQTEWRQCGAQQSDRGAG